MLRFINSATFSAGTPVRTELVEVRAFHGRNSEKQHLAGEADLAAEAGGQAIVGVGQLQAPGQEKAQEATV